MQSESPNKQATLYTEPKCPYSIFLVRMLEYLEISEVEINSEDSQVLEQSLYQELPILKHRGRLIEDFRAILRHLDTLAPQTPIKTLSTREQCALFEELEELDQTLISDINLALQPSSKSFLQRLTSGTKLKQQELKERISVMQFRREELTPIGKIFFEAGERALGVKPRPSARIEKGDE